MENRSWRSGRTLPVFAATESSAVTRGIRSKRIPGIRYIAVAIRIVSQPPAIS
jgi:ribosomal protein S12